MPSSIAVAQLLILFLSAYELFSPPLYGILGIMSDAHYSLFRAVWCKPIGNTLKHTSGFQTFHGNIIHGNSEIDNCESEVHEL